MSQIIIKNLHINYQTYSSTALSIKGSLHKFFSSKRKGIININALKNINLSINNGERVGLIGVNGSGKTSLLKTISQIYSPSAGSCYVSDPITNLIDLNLGFNPEFTGREFIYLRAMLNGIMPTDIEDKISEIIKFSELQEYIDLPLNTYSSGMQLRLGFSIATAFRPKILIMDEWLSTGDKKFIKKSENKLNNLINNSNILIIASHDFNILERVTNRVIWLHHGEVIEDDVPSKIFKKYYDNEKLYSF